MASLARWNRLGTLNGTRWRNGYSGNYHLIGSRIQESLAFDYLGLIGPALPLIASNGSDGVVDLENALGGGTEGDDGRSLVALAAHGRDAAYFGNAPLQTHSPETAQRAIEALDRLSTEESVDGDALATAIGPGQSNPLTTVREKLIKDLVQLRVKSQIAAITAVADPPGGQRKGINESFDFALTPVGGEPAAGNATWIAEVYGPGGVTAEGIVVSPDGSDPLQVSVSVAGSVVGDVVLYGSYPTADGVVFAAPILVTSRNPAGAVAQSLEIQPAEMAIESGETVSPVLWVRYSDGSLLRRWVTADEILVSSSDPQVVDAGDKLRWVGGDLGTATITVTYAGLDVQSELAVSDGFPPLSYSAWKAEVFDPAQLADPSVSDDGVDAEGDTLGVFMEYITGGSPFDLDPGSMPKILRADLGSGIETLLSVRISSRLVGDVVEIQFSPDLENWQPLLTVSGEPDPGDPVIVSIEENGPYFQIILRPPSGTDAEFYRLAVPEGPGNPLPEGAIAYYPLNGDTDDAIGTNHGGATTAVLTTDRSGNPDSAYLFDGDDSIDLTSPLPIGATDHTIAVWVKVPLPNTGGLTPFEPAGVVLGNFSDSPYANWDITDAGFMHFLWDGGSLQWFELTDLRDNAWHHLAWVRDRGAPEYYLYRDGVRRTSVGLTGADVSFATTHRIGADNRGAGTPYFHGAIDDLVIYDRALSAEEIGTLAE